MYAIDKLFFSSTNLLVAWYFKHVSPSCCVFMSKNLNTKPYSEVNLPSSSHLLPRTKLCSDEAFYSIAKLIYSSSGAADVT